MVVVSKSLEQFCIEFMRNDRGEEEEETKSTLEKSQLFVDANRDIDLETKRPKGAIRVGWNVWST